MGSLFRRILRLGASLALSALAAWVMNRIRGRRRAEAGFASGAAAAPEGDFDRGDETASAAKRADDDKAGRRYPTSGIYEEEGGAERSGGGTPGV